MPKKKARTTRVYFVCFFPRKDDGFDIFFVPFRCTFPVAVFFAHDFFLKKFFFFNETKWRRKKNSEKKEDFGAKKICCSSLYIMVRCR